MLFEYDNASRLARHTDENGGVTSFTYTGMDRVKTRTNPDGTVVQYVYDTEDRLKILANERGAIHEFTRDHAGRVVAQTDYFGQTTAYDYDPAGRLIRSTDPLSRVLSFAYDNLDRMTEKTGSDGTKETFSFDSNGNLTAHKNDASHCEYTLDAENRPVKESEGSHTTLREYDILGNPTRRLSSFGNDIRYDYDSLNRVTAITVNGTRTDIQRDALGLPVKETFSSGMTRSYAYTTDNLTASQEILLPGGSAIRRSYEYDTKGNLTARTDDDKGVRRFIHDPMDRITRYIVPENKLKKYLHDPAGNLLKSLEKDEAGGNRTSFHQNTAYTFDAAGNLIERNGKRGHTTFSWDAQNRLMSAVNQETGIKTHMTYDALGRRLSKTTSDQTTTFTWDGDQLLSDNLGGHNQREYVYYPGTFVPFAIIDKDKKVHYVHTDSVGLPQEITDDTSNILWSASYDALGNVEKLHADTFDNPLRLQGQYYDSELDLSYNRYRYFDPRTTSFISQDPLGLVAGVNVYSYAPNVWGWVDPLGLACKKTAPAKLPNDLAATFEGGKYSSKILEKDTTFYRSGTKDQPLGQFFSDVAPVSEIQARIDKAILPVWPGGGKSPIDTVFKVKIPKGTTIHTGKIASQGGFYVGGTKQVVVEKPWLVKGVDVIDSWPIVK